jgi:hypothetical protein
MAIFESLLMALLLAIFDLALMHKIGYTNVGAIIYVGLPPKKANKFQLLVAHNNR